MKAVLTSLVNGKIRLACLVTPNHSGLLHMVKNELLRKNIFLEMDLYEIVGGVSSIKDIRSIIERMRVSASSHKTKVCVCIYRAADLSPACITTLLQVLEEYSSTMCLISTSRLVKKLDPLVSRTIVIPCPFMPRDIIKREAEVRGLSTSMVKDLYDGTFDGTFEKIVLADQMESCMSRLHGSRSDLSDLLCEESLMSDAMREVLLCESGLLRRFLSKDSKSRRILLAAHIWGEHNERLRSSGSKSITV